MLAIALSVVALSPFPQAPQRAPGALEVYPLRGLIGPVDQAVRPPMTSFLQVRNFGELEDERMEIDRDAVLRALLDVYRNDVDAGRLQLEMREQMLIAKGDPGTVADVGRKLEQLTAAVTRPITIEASLHERAPDGAPPEPFVRPEDLARLRQADVLWSATVRTRPGVRVALGNERWTHYVRDLEVEVAEEAGIADPKVGVFFEGARLLVEPHALAGTEDIALFCWFAVGGRRAPTEARSAVVREQPTVDVPHLNFNTGRMSGRIVDQGALVATLDGDAGSGSRLVLVVTARHAAPPSDPPEPIHLIPTSALSSSAFRTSPSMPRLYPDLSGQDDLFFHSDPEAEPFYGPHDPNELQQIVEAAVEGIAAPEYVDTLGRIGPFLYGCGASDDFARVEQAVQRLQGRWLRNSELSIRTGLVPATDGPTPFGRAGRESVPASGRDLHTVVVPALLGRQHVVSRGTETTVIRDYDVEIAQKSSMANPVIVPQFSGVSAMVRPYAGTGGMGADVLVDLIVDDPPRHRPAETDQIGDLYLPSTGRVRFRQQAVWRSGAPLRLGTGPLVEIDGRTWLTVQELGISLPE